MDAIAELLMVIVVFLIEVTFHAVVFIFLLLMAIFSSRYRKKLKERWDTSNWQRLGIVLGVAMYSTALIGVVWFWFLCLGRSADEGSETHQKHAKRIEFSTEEVRRIEKTKEVGQFVEAAGSIIKRKLAERKQESQEVGGEPHGGTESE